MVVVGEGGGRSAEQLAALTAVVVARRRGAESTSTSEASDQLPAAEERVTGIMQHRTMFSLLCKPRAILVGE